MSRKLQKFLFLCVAVIILYFLDPQIQPKVQTSQTPTPTQKEEQTAKVTRVIDGDTFVIDDGEKVRLIGVDTPETVDPKKPVQCYGKEASDESKKLLTGQTVTLIKDKSDKDVYGRLLRYVYFNTTFVNEFLVEDGFAKATPYPPDTKYESLFQKAQEQAQAQKLGLWNACPQN